MAKTPEMPQEFKNQFDRDFADCIVQIKPGDEIECDRARLTETAVLVRAHGIWSELRPPYTATGNRPLFNERRLIDGMPHVWCGQGWIAECYSDYIHWPIQDGIALKSVEHPPGVIDAIATAIRDRRLKA